MFIIEEELKKLPVSPGVYIMRDKNDKIIYVGKAISLKRRVTSYFRKTNKTQRIQNMVALIDHFEYIVVDNEAEALVLECNLIKKNRPKFNVLLKDDKTYPYIKINVKDDYPMVYITRRILNDGAKYFGPYPSGGSAQEMIEFLKDKFKLRHCKNFKFKDRPCLNYDIKKCSAPCQGYISKEEYRKSIDQVISILDGKTAPLVKEIKTEMEKASNNQEYEKAASLRDKLLAIESVSSKQTVANISANDIDVIGLAKSSTRVCVEIFFVRNAKMIGREHYFFDNIVDEDENEILEEFVKQYYASSKYFPNKIMIRAKFEDKELLEDWLSKMALEEMKHERHVEIKTPQKGEKLRLVEMAENNAKITLENKEKDKISILKEIQEICKMDKIPRRIETYDISNISGTNQVAGMAVMENGVIKKNLSRRFKIKTVYGQDDPRCMQEVIERRLKHDGDGLGKLPDAIFVDGGINQIRAAEKAIGDNSIYVFGMVKNDKHQTRALINSNKEELQISDELFKLITLFQDTVHDTAIGYHRMLREKEATRSSLDNIPGIGPIKRTALMKKFKTVSKIKEASISELMEVKGINKELAKIIKESINE